MHAPTLDVVTLPIAGLVVRDGNPRRSDVRAIADSLAAFGQYKPVVVNRRDSRVIAGRAVLAAAQSLGWESIAAAYVDVDDETARRIELRDNRCSDLATYDDAELLALLESLPDLEDTGWTSSDLAELAATLGDEPAALTDPDDAPPAPATPVSARGEVYLCGEHRVMCGDATSADDVAALVAGATVDAVWTDPPYGVDYVGGTADALRIRNDDLTPDALGELLAGAFARIAEHLRSGGAFYVCSPSGALETVFRRELDGAGLPLRQQLVWVKDRFVLGHSDYHNRHESILFGWAEGAEPAPVPPYDVAHGTVLYGWAEGAGHDWQGDRRQDTVWEHDRPAASRLHPTMKPVALVRRGVENSTRAGGVVLDLFGGSGSLLIAAHATRRRALVMELDEAYVDVILRRWEEHTGITPVLERTGQPVSFTADA